MANLNKKRTITIRCDPDFKTWVNKMSRFKSNQEDDDIKSSRITQAVFNLRFKYPIDDEIKKAKLGKWKSR